MRRSSNRGIVRQHERSFYEVSKMFRLIVPPVALNGQPWDVYLQGRTVRSRIEYHCSTQRQADTAVRLIGDPVRCGILDWKLSLRSR